MFSVGVVLLVLERTGSAELAGATVAAITLPSLLTGPLLGAWLDLTGRRRVLMIVDQVVIASVLVALVALIGHGPDWMVPLVVLAAGVALFALRRVHQLDPDDRARRAASACERARDRELQRGAGGSASCWHARGRVRPRGIPVVEATLAIAALGLILRIPGSTAAVPAPTSRFAAPPWRPACARSWPSPSCAA